MNLSALRLFTNKNYGVIRGLYCMISHNFISSGLSILAEVLYNRYQTYLLKKYSSLFDKSPNITKFIIFLTFANISLPLTGNFIGKLLVFLSLSKYNFYSIILICFYILVTCIYSIMLMVKVLFGSTKIFGQKYSKNLIIIRDSTLLKYHLLFLLSLITILMRLFPKYILDYLFYNI